MHVLALVNQKGGCGKTTAAVHLSGALAARGERVLLVDLDPQAHATLALGCAIEGEPALGDALEGTFPLEAIVRPAPGGIRLAPGSDRLAEFEEMAARTIRPERALERVLGEVSTGHDFAIVDCPPRADGLLTANALRAADTVVLVVECGTFALQGALKALRILEEAMGGDPRFRVRVLATLFDRESRFSRDLLVGMQARFGPLMFDTAIRTDLRLREAAAFGVPVSILEPCGPAAENFASLALEISPPVRRSAPDVALPGELRPSASPASMAPAPAHATRPATP